MQRADQGMPSRLLLRVRAHMLGPHFYMAAAWLHATGAGGSTGPGNDPDRGPSLHVCALHNAGKGAFKTDGQRKQTVEKGIQNAVQVRRGGWSDAARGAGTGANQDWEGCRAVPWGRPGTPLSTAAAGRLRGSSCTRPGALLLAHARAP